MSDTAAFIWLFIFLGSLTAVILLFVGISRLLRKNQVISPTVQVQPPMAKCFMCEQSTQPLELDEHGLCPECHAIAQIELPDPLRIIAESIDLINNSKNYDTRISRCTVVISMAEELLKYEKKNISVIEPAPSELIRIATEKREDFILSSILELLAEAKEKEKTLKSNLAKYNQWAKAKLKIDKLVEGSLKKDLLIEFSNQAQIKADSFEPKT